MPQFFIFDNAVLIDLNTFPKSAGCVTWDVDPGGFVTTIELSEKTVDIRLSSLVESAWTRHRE
jgi:hypothetical protein